MTRNSPCYYIAPGAISVSPNANGSASDLAVSILRGTKIKVFSLGISDLGWSDTEYQQWTLSGRNRRLADNEKPYTIYARLSKTNKEDGYLIFAPKTADGDKWLDKYAYVTMSGLALGTTNKNSDDYWYVKLGEVSLPADNKRTLTLDTGILGTDQFNNEWSLNPEANPLRVELTATIESKDAGDKPYVPWGKSLMLRARLLEGWANADVPRFHHWTIQRNTGNAVDDTAYNYPNADSDSTKPSTGRQMPGGNITLNHARGEGDVFDGNVSSIWAVVAWGTKTNSNASSSSSSTTSADTYEKLAEKSINIMAETAEQFELELSSAVANYDPSTDTYGPSSGIDVMIRATDQKSEVFRLTNAQRKAASLVVQYSVAGLEQWNTCEFKGDDTAVFKGNIPIDAFKKQKNVDVRIAKTQTSSSSSSSSSTTYKEIYRSHIALVRNGEDSKEREWIYLRSKTALQFAETADDTHKLLPALIKGGEVKPEETATGSDTKKDQDGWVPEGWWDDSLGTDKTFHYEYAAYRDYIKGSLTSDSSSSKSISSSSGNAKQRDGHWGDFTAPRIWSYYAEDAVTYRCRWTLAGVEVYQLKCAYTGAFRGNLPLVATLMKRVGSGQEQEVKGGDKNSVGIVLSCEGIDYSKTFNADNPTFTISTTDANASDFVQYLNNVALNGLTVSFTVDGEVHNFSIPVIREADEDSVIDTIDKKGSKFFLRKDKDDETPHELTMKQATIRSTAQSDDFKSGFPLGKGWSALNSDSDGASVFEVDKLLVRMKAVFAELEYRKVSYVNGNFIFSAAGGKVYYVEWRDRAGKVLDQTDANKENLYTIRCYLYSDDGTMATRNWFEADDQVRCQNFGDASGTTKVLSDFTKDNYTTHYWWRRVDSVGESEIAAKGDRKKYQYVEFLNNTWDCADGSDLPEVGDTMVQLGNWTKSERQNAIEIRIIGDDAPAFIEWQGIGANSKHFQMPDENYTRLSPKAGNLIKGELINVVTNSDGTVTTQKVSDLISGMEDKIADIQAQADKKFEIWFGSGDPHPNSVSDTVAETTPSSEWKNDTIKALHVQDIYYNTDIAPASEGGNAWRYVSGTNDSGGTVYYWEKVTDQQTIAALQKAEKLQEQVDVRISIFVTKSTELPTPPYKEGDLWMQTDKNNHIMVCVKPKAEGETAVASDWEDLSKYSSDHDLRNLLKLFGNTIYDKILSGLTSRGNVNVWLKPASDPAGAECEVWYDGTNCKIYGTEWTTQTDVSLAAALSSIMKLLGEGAKFTVFGNTTSAAQEKYDLELYKNSWANLKETKTFQSELQIRMWNGSMWEDLQTSDTGVLENLGGEIDAVVYGSDGNGGNYASGTMSVAGMSTVVTKYFETDGTVKANGLLTTKEGASLYSKLTDSSGNIITSASIGTKIVTDSNGNSTTYATISGDNVVCDATHQIKIDSAGGIIINKGNFTIDADGTATMYNATMTGGTVTIGSDNKVLIKTDTDYGGTMYVNEGSNTVLKIGVTGYKVNDDKITTVGEEFNIIKSLFSSEDIAKHVANGPYIRVGYRRGGDKGQTNPVSFMSSNFLFSPRMDTNFIRASGFSTLPFIINDETGSINSVIDSLDDLDDLTDGTSGVTEEYRSVIVFKNTTKAHTFTLGDPAGKTPFGLVKNEGRVLICWHMGKDITFKSNSGKQIFAGSRGFIESITTTIVGEVYVFISDGKEWLLQGMQIGF